MKIATAAQHQKCASAQRKVMESMMPLAQRAHGQPLVIEHSGPRRDGAFVPAQLPGVLPSLQPRLVRK